MGSAWSRKQATIDAAFEAAPRDVSSWDLQHVKILHKTFRVSYYMKQSMLLGVHRYITAAAVYCAVFIVFSCVVAQKALYIASFDGPN